MTAPERAALALRLEVKAVRAEKRAREARQTRLPWQADPGLAALAWAADLRIGGQEQRITLSSGEQDVWLDLLRGAWAAAMAHPARALDELHQANAEGGDA